MKIYIEYEMPTASGNKAIHGAILYTFKEVEDFCSAVEAVGYKIVMVNREE